MSRAFTRENSGWNFCADKLEDCIFAGETGECLVGSCKLYLEEKPKQKEIEPEQKSENQADDSL